MKAAGATNRQIAKYLYGVDNPTDNQIHAIPVRLKNFGETMKRQGSKKL